MKLSLLPKVSGPLPPFPPPPICIESRVWPIIQPFLFSISDRQQPLPHRAAHDLFPLPPLPADMLRVWIVRRRIHPPKVTLFSYPTPFCIPCFASTPLVLVRRRVGVTAPVVRPVVVVLVACVTKKSVKGTTGGEQMHRSHDILQRDGLSYRRMGHPYMAGTSLPIITAPFGAFVGIRTTPPSKHCA